MPANTARLTLERYKQVLLTYLTRPLMWLLPLGLLMMFFALESGNDSGMDVFGSVWVAVLRAGSSVDAIRAAECFAYAALCDAPYSGGAADRCSRSCAYMGWNNQCGRGEAGAYFCGRVPDGGNPVAGL